MGGGGRGRILAVVVALLATGCGSPVPTPQAPTLILSSSPAPPEATVSTTPGPTAPPPSPTVDCADPSVFTPRPTLTCDAAVAAATRLLQSGVLTVTGIDFSYGTWCPPGARCAATLPDRGYVVFHLIDRSALFVTVAEGRGPGSISTGPLRPFPPALGHFYGYEWSFDYPIAWQFSPVAAHFEPQQSIGYLGTIQVDQGTICQTTASSETCHFYGYDLPPANVVVHVSRVFGVDDPILFFDHSTRGTRMEVAGMPALRITRQTATDRALVTWIIDAPYAFGAAVAVEADLHGPDDGTMRAQVDAMVASFRFEPPPVPVVPGDAVAADAMAAKAIDALVAADPQAYACFPDRPGVTRTANVRTLPTVGTLKKTLPVSCSIAITATDVGMWRIELTASWAAAGDRKAGTGSVVQWVLGDGELVRQTGGWDRVPYCCR